MPLRMCWKVGNCVYLFGDSTLIRALFLIIGMVASGVQKVDFVYHSGDWAGTG